MYIDGKKFSEKYTFTDIWPLIGNNTWNVYPGKTSYEDREPYEIDWCKQNAIAFLKFFILTGYKITLEAIAGLLGNISVESQLNPGQVEQDSGYNLGWTTYRKGHGLIQWTGETNEENPLLDWHLCNKDSDYAWADGNLQCYRIICEGERTNKAGGYWLTSPSYSYTWEEFCNLTSYEEAMRAYLAQRERAGVSALERRKTCTEKWYVYLKSYLENPDNGLELDITQPFDARTNNNEVIYNNKLYMASSRSGGLNNCKARVDFSDYIGSGTFRRLIKYTEDEEGKRIPVYKYFYGHEELENGSVLPNCTGYAWGRASEIMGEETPNNLSTSNACKWFLKDGKHGYGDDGYERSTTVPKLGAVICWAGTAANTAGHVAIVEKINRDENGKLISIEISESGYYGGFSHSNYYNTSTINANKLVEGAIRSSSAFQGYIYLPNVGGSIVRNQVTLDRLEFIKISDTSIKVSLKVIAGELSENDFSYSLLANLGNKTQINSTSNENNQYFFNIENLSPDTEYTLTFFAQNDQIAVTSTDSFIFKTRQSIPKQVTNLQIETTDTFKLSSSLFTASFNAPEDWGYWKDNNKGYVVHLISNGKSIASYEKEYKNNYETFAFTPNNFLEKSLKTGETLQIGVQSFVTTGDGEKVYSEIAGSNAVCLRENDFEVYLKY